MTEENLCLNLRKQVEDYAAKLAITRARCEQAEERARRWKQLAMQRGCRDPIMRQQVAAILTEEATPQCPLSDNDTGLRARA